MKKLIALFMLVIALLVSGCSDNQELSIKVILSALESEGIKYEEMSTSPELRKTENNYSYKLDEGRLIIHFFSTVNDRVEVQKDPYPMAMFVKPTSTYGIGNILIFYMDGNEDLTAKLDTAFKEWQ